MTDTSGILPHDALPWNTGAPPDPSNPAFVARQTALLIQDKTGRYDLVPYTKDGDWGWYAPEQLHDVAAWVVIGAALKEAKHG